MSDPYVYPGTEVLRNKQGIRDAHQLAAAERTLVMERLSQGVPRGNFDLEHLQSIHRHLFQDVYEWAGDIRTLEISKGGSQFQFRQYIGMGMADVHRRLVETNFLRGLRPSEFARQAGGIIGDVNYVHPFREGNGRVQLQYLKQLAEQAGHSLDLTKLTPGKWLAASKEAHQGRYEGMTQAINECLLVRGKTRQKDQGRER